MKTSAKILKTNLIIILVAYTTLAMAQAANGNTSTPTGSYGKKDTFTSYDKDQHKNMNGVSRETIKVDKKVQPGDNSNGNMQAQGDNMNGTNPANNVARTDNIDNTTATDDNPVPPATELTNVTPSYCIPIWGGIGLFILGLILGAIIGRVIQQRKTA